MKKYKYTLAIALTAILTSTSCKKNLDINNSPNSPTDVPLTQLYTGAAVNIGFTGGSDASRFTALITQQFSGQSSGTLNQTQQYETYLIQGSDLNNLWSSFYTNTLINLNIVIAKAQSTGSPHYSGVAKLLEAYTFSLMVDLWGKIPYTEALKQTVNIAPHYDDDASIYASLLTMIDSGIADVSAAPAGVEIPNASPIYPFPTSSTFAASAQPQWIKFGNTLKLRLLLHLYKKDPAGTLAKINALIASGTFMSGVADNFSGNFLAAAGASNPIFQFEASRQYYLAANNFMVSLMGSKGDPRLPFYFTPAVAVVATTKTNSGATTVTLTKATYNGVDYEGSVAGATTSSSYSKIGAQTGAANAVNYYLTGSAGAAPVRMLTYAEYNFIRAEVALNGATGNAEAFFTAGITAAMTDAGVSSANIATYLLANGTLSGTPAHQLQQIIEEKYVANFGVAVEPWTDYRRTGYPLIAQPTTPNFQIASVPRSLYYPQSEINYNPSATQKPDLLQKVFWDVP